MNAPTGGYPNWIDPASGDHCYARTGSSRLGQSPPPVCLCGHDFHAGVVAPGPSVHRRLVDDMGGTRWWVEMMADLNTAREDFKW